MPKQEQYFPLKWQTFTSEQVQASKEIQNRQPTCQSYHKQNPKHDNPNACPNTTKGFEYKQTHKSTQNKHQIIGRGRKQTADNKQQKQNKLERERLTLIPEVVEALLLV